MRFFRFALLVMFVLVLSGCSMVIEQIQQVTGNNVKNVRGNISDLSNVNYEKQLYEQGIPPSPNPSPKLNDILNDNGEGRYAGDPYQAQKVMQALNIMPEGLTDDKVYAYLLGLVGKNYKNDITSLSDMLGPNYQAKLRVITYGERITPPPPPKKKPPVVAAKPKPKPTTKPKPPKPKPTNVMVLMDVSSTMSTIYQGKSRYDWSKLYTMNFIHQLPKSTNVSVRLFGHKGGPSKKDKDVSCSQTEEIYHSDPTHIPELVSKFSQAEPTGWSPLANALQTAMTELGNQQLPQVKNVIYVIADSSDTCGADLDQEISDIAASRLAVMVNVIGIDVPTQDETELTELAEETGGDYQPIANAEDVTRIAKDSASEVSQIHEPWELRALQKTVNGYEVTNKRLDSKYQQIVTNLKEEHQRLTTANQLVKDQHKINAIQWAKIKGWIDSRYEGVLGFTEQKWHSKQAEFDQSVNNSLQFIEQKWELNKQSLKPYEKQKNTLLQEVKKVQANSSNDNPEE